jgi:hypothetical protein
MRNCRLALVVFVPAMAVLFAGSVRGEALEADIECQPNDQYYLCEARPTGEVTRFDWSVTGDLDINLASGPLVSVGCRAGESGALRLEMAGPEGAVGEASLVLECEKVGKG